VAVPPMDFSTDRLKESVATLREGSDRLVANFTARFPEAAHALFHEEVRDIFEAAAIILGLSEGSIDAVGLEAMKFQGKGGVQIDTRYGDKRFSPYAFVASLMSYRLAGAETTLLAYSIFESFGDYIADVALGLKAKAEAEHLVLCGRAFGNPSLFARVQKKLGRQSLLTNRAWPIDEENVLLGTLAL
jgi:hydrogenase maturation factor HypF (carbamoyltransferase family)